MKPPTTLSIQTASGRVVDNRFFDAGLSNGWLALVLPGLAYSADMPLLYYSKLLLLNRSVDVLQLMPATLSAEFQALDAAGRQEWLRQDVLAGLEAGLAQRDYRGILLVGKSIGTIGVALALREAEARLPSVAVWLTPLFREKVVMDAAMTDEGPAFFLCGGADTTYLHDSLDQILKARTKAIACVIPKADHSLELGGDEDGTFDALRQGMQALARFLDDVLE